MEKGTQGIDGRVVAPKSKELRAFVITLGRAGEDGKTFILRDTESTFAGFAGADYNLQVGHFLGAAADNSCLCMVHGACHHSSESQSIVPQDALSSATNIDRTKRTVDGVDFYDYDIDSPVSSAHGLAATMCPLSLFILSK